MDVIYMQPSLDNRILITVFMTNVITKKDASFMLELLNNEFQNCRFNFDLEDCDHIFRMESGTDIGREVIRHFEDQGFTCDLLR